MARKGTLSMGKIHVKELSQRTSKLRTLGSYSSHTLSKSPWYWNPYSTIFSHNTEVYNNLLVIKKKL